MFSYNPAGAKRAYLDENANVVGASEPVPRALNSFPIRLKSNPLWINQETRPACKYSPVKVPESTHEGVSQSMRAVLHSRIETCRTLAGERSFSGDNSRWLSFIRGPQLNDVHFNQGTVPALVISGGSANKLAADLRNDYSLAWHPKNMRVGLDGRSDPVYLIVHKLDYPTYASALSDALESYPNLRIIGADLDGPAEQFVSVSAPYRRNRGDGIYDSYMVAGGEDMLMSKKLGLSKEGRNTAQVQERIVKKELIGPPDVPNTYWNEGRVQTLKALFEAEKNTLVEFEGESMTLDRLMSKFVGSGWISSHPSVDSYTAAACIVERIILRLESESRG